MTTNKREEYNIDDTDNSESVILTKPENNEMFSGDQLKKINIINQEILLPSLQEFIEIDHKKFNTTYKDSREVADNNNHYRLSKINEGFDIIEKTEEPEKSVEENVLYGGGKPHIGSLSNGKKYIYNTIILSEIPKNYYIFRIILKKGNYNFVNKKNEIIENLTKKLQLEEKKDIKYIKQNPFPTNKDHDANEDNYNTSNDHANRIILIFKLSGTSLFLKYKEFYELNYGIYENISRSNQHPGITVYPDQNDNKEIHKNALYEDDEDEEDYTTFGVNPDFEEEEIREQKIRKQEEESENEFGFGVGGRKRRTRKHFSKKCHKTLKRKCKKILRRKHFSKKCKKTLLRKHFGRGTSSKGKKTLRRK